MSDKKAEGFRDEEQAVRIEEAYYYLMEALTRFESEVLKDNFDVKTYGLFVILRNQFKEIKRNAYGYLKVGMYPDEERRRSMYED